MIGDVRWNSMPGLVNMSGWRPGRVVDLGVYFQFRYHYSPNIYDDN